jgi:hypothetical protein
VGVGDSVEVWLLMGVGVVADIGGVWVGTGYGAFCWVCDSCSLRLDGSDGDTELVEPWLERFLEQGAMGLVKEE